MKKWFLAAMMVIGMWAAAPGISVSAEESVEFVYVEKETVALSEEQNVVIGIGESVKTVCGAELYYHREEDGEKFQAAAEAISGSAALFSAKYSQQKQTGTYVLDKMVYETSDGEEYQVNLQQESEIKYGMGCEVEVSPEAMTLEEVIDGEGDVVSVEMESVSQSRGDGQASDAVDSENDGQASDKAELSLGNVEEAAAYATAALDIGSAGEATAYGKSADFVIVLDPGHGGSDPGAVRIHNGVTYAERDFVLKIANYCKEELEKYAGIKVYLTRTNNASTLMDRRQRTQFALEKGADVIVSLHLNATGETYTSVSGALVYCPYNNTNSGIVSQYLAYAVLEELEKLGLKNRGILIDEELGMIKYPKENGVPGILIEHCFINSASDVANHLTSEGKLKQLGIADANALVTYFNLKEVYTQYEQDSGTMKVTASADGTKYTLKTSGVPDAYSVEYAMWREGDNENATVWKKAVKNKSGVWKSNFLVSDYKKKGTYHVEAYVVNQNKTQVRVASRTIQVKGPSAKKISTESLNPQKGTFKVRITEVESQAAIEKVTVKVWSQADKQDTYTYRAKLQKDGSYAVTANIKRHNYNYGTYYYYVYAKDVNGIVKRFYKKKLSLKRPDLHMKVWANKNQTKYTVAVDKALGIKSVSVAVWSKKSGQNDLQWYSAKVNKNNRWAATVNIADHRSFGTYYADVYGINAAGQNIFLERKTFQVKAPVIQEVVISKSNPKAGTFQMNINGVTAKAGMDKVTVTAWTQKDKSDAYTYTAAVTKDGNYRVKVDVKNHAKSYGVYQLQVYAKDTRGVIKTKKLTYEFLNVEE